MQCSCSGEGGFLLTCLLQAVNSSRIVYQQALLQGHLASEATLSPRGILCLPLGIPMSARGAQASESSVLTLHISVPNCPLPSCSLPSGIPFSVRDRLAPCLWVSPLVCFPSPGFCAMGSSAFHCLLWVEKQSHLESPCIDLKLVTFWLNPYFPWVRSIFTFSGCRLWSWHLLPLVNSREFWKPHPATLFM